MSEPRQQLMEMGCAIKRTPDEITNTFVGSTSFKKPVVKPCDETNGAPRHCYE